MGTMKASPCPSMFDPKNIKNVILSDKDVGNMGLKACLMISKALELFIQDLCDRTFAITRSREAHLVTPQHLKKCIQCYPLFDFLEDKVSHVPDVVEDLKKRRKSGKEVNGASAARKCPKLGSSSGGGKGCGRRNGNGGSAKESDGHEVPLFGGNAGKDEGRDVTTNTTNHSIKLNAFAAQDTASEAAHLLQNPELITGWIKEIDEKCKLVNDDYDCEDE